MSNLSNSRFSPQNLNNRSSTMRCSQPSNIPTIPSGPIDKPPYSPRTTINMNLRFLDRQSKKQAETEYDQEHGPDHDLAVSPCVEESSPTDQDSATQVKKRRKVRSAIVSRRKTAIYVEKLEAEVNERENENKDLREKLLVFREVMQDIKDAIEATQGGGCEPEPRTPNKRSRPSPPKFLHPSTSGGDINTAYASAQPNQYANNYYAPTYPTSYNSQAITSHLPPLQTSQGTHQPPTSFHQSYPQPQQNTQGSPFFLDEEQPNEPVKDMYTLPSEEAVGNNACVSMFNIVAQHQNPSFQTFTKNAEYDADLISDCSDRMVSPVMNSRAPYKLAEKRKYPTYLAQQQEQFAKQSEVAAFAAIHGRKDSQSFQ